MKLSMATIAPEEPVSGLAQARGLDSSADFAATTVDLISSASVASIPAGLVFFNYRMCNQLVAVGYLWHACASYRAAAKHQPCHQKKGNVRANVQTDRVYSLRCPPLSSLFEGT